MALIALGATGGYEETERPPYGQWTLTVAPITPVPVDACNAVAHAYVARNDYNFGGLRRGWSSHFWLPDYDPERFMRSREDDPLPPPSGSRSSAVRIRSAGTISGLATGRMQMSAADRRGASIAAGYRMSDNEPAIYSSGGPTRDPAKRKGPNWAFPTDESRVFRGLISWGNRSGASVRLVGTSMAAPQYARLIDQSGELKPPAGKTVDPRLGWGLK